MSTNTVAPKETKIRITNTVTDLDTFEDVKLVKEIDPVSPVQSVEDALSRLNNDGQKLLDILTRGLQAEVRDNAAEKADGWMYENSDGDLVPYSGTPADSTAVSTLRRTIAMTIYGYSGGRDLSAEQKAANKKALDSAMSMIKDTPVLRQGLAIRQKQ